MNKKYLLIITMLLFTAVLGGSVIAATAVDADMSPEYTGGWHETNQEMSCIDCHGDENGEGDVSRNTCLDCHGPEADLIASTEHLKETYHRNPHDGHYIDLECSMCHQGHSEDYYLCGDCH